VVPAGVVVVFSVLLQAPNSAVDNTIVIISAEAVTVFFMVVLPNGQSKIVQGAAARRCRSERGKSAGIERRITRQLTQHPCQPSRCRKSLKTIFFL
jgi:hypothetical protein